jgi:molybdate/tungstate transport system ATP-binding protein
MLQIRNISKRLDNFSISDMSFTVRKGEYFILLGVSGAGKSLLLEMIAGLVLPDAGSILMDDRDITREKIQSRGIGLVFQDYAVFPHLSVRENVGYSLHGSHLSHAEKRQRIREISEKMNISHLLQRRPSTLSGGEQQRVALARTLVQNPKILLLDEPLSSLDPKLRGEIRSLLRRINRDGQTVIHVTHDYEEAISLADTIAVVNSGCIVQTGTPEQVFAHPKSEFVAHFIGIKNFYKASVVHDGSGIHAVTSENLRMNLGPGDHSPNGFVLIRSEDVILSQSPFDSSATNVFRGKVIETVPTRAGTEVNIDIGAPLFALITERSAEHLGINPGSEIYVSFKATAVRYINI